MSYAIRTQSLTKMFGGFDAGSSIRFNFQRS